MLAGFFYIGLVRLITPSTRKLAQMAAVPTVDISPFTAPAEYDDAARRAVGQEWDAAMTNVGFAMIVGHGVDPGTVDALRRGAHSFFGGPAETKNTFNYGPYGHPLGGFTGMGVEAVARSRDDHGSDGGAQTTAALPDLVESFVFKPKETTKPKPSSLDEPGKAYHTALLKVLNALHRVTASALDLNEGFFEPYYGPTAGCSLKLAYYPPLERAQQASSAVRYGAHTDYTGYTILCQDAADVGDLDAGGLQVLLKSGAWAAVTPQANAFVVNIGDLYEVWTNGRWRSTLHRVLKPPIDSAAAVRPRLSIPFFTGPRNDAVITCLPTCVSADTPAKYAPIQAGEHLLRKLGISNV